MYLLKIKIISLLFGKFNYYEKLTAMHGNEKTKPVIIGFAGSSLIFNVQGQIDTFGQMENRVLCF